MFLAHPFSHATVNLQRSVMRDLLALTTRPGILSFAGGLPADECLPRDQIQACINAVLTRDGAKALQYGPPFAPLKEQIALYMKTRGVVCTTDDIFITSGNQQGLEIIMRVLLDSGDAALVEQFTFTGIVQATRGRGADLIPLPVDLQTGVDVAAFESALTHHPRAAALIPDFHNPLGVSLSKAKRIRLAHLAAEHDLPLIEDDPYSALRFEGEALPPIKAYDEAGAVIYLGSFSKMLAPATRLGWMVAPRVLLPKLTVVRESLDLESSQLIQRAVAEFLARGLLAPHLAHLNAVNHTRRDAMLAALQRELGDLVHWTVPQGGLFIWLTLPAGIDTGVLFNAALEQDVAFVPGHAFAVDCNEPHNSLRLNFSNATPEKIDEGIRRLASVIKNQPIVKMPEAL
jgi:2-aminoadipate transaminase